MALKEKSEMQFDEIEWNVENEIQLFFAMNGHKPVGKYNTRRFASVYLCRLCLFKIKNKVKNKVL